MSKGTIVLRAGRPSANNKPNTLASLSTEPATKRVNFELSAELHAKLKVHSAKTGRSIKELFTEYVDSLPNT